VNRKNASAESLTLFYLAKSLDRQHSMEKLIQQLWSRLEREHILLNSALHDLAAAAKKPGVSQEKFIGDWYRKRGGKL
jgi:DNA-binding SARP family transcriptional activator